MTRLSEDIYSLGDSVDEPCFHCGNKTDRGGRWIGAGREVVICRDSECVRAAMHLLHDAIYDVTEDGGATRDILTNLTKQVIVEKGADSE